MDLREALQEAGSHPKSQSRQSISARTLAVEVRRLQTTLSGKSQFDVATVTAKRCAEIAVAQMAAPPGAWGQGATFNALKIERLIKEEFGLSD